MRKWGFRLGGSGHRSVASALLAPRACARRGVGRGSLAGNRASAAGRDRCSRVANGYDREDGDAWHRGIAGWYIILPLFTPNRSIAVCRFGESLLNVRAPAARYRLAFAEAVRRNAMKKA